MWAQLPPAVQQEVLKREADIFQGIEQYRDLAQTGRVFQQALAPFQEHFRAAGMDPVATVGNLLNAHHVLARGTADQKLQLVRAIITERVYLVPGIGNVLTTAINKYDNGVIVGVALFYALLSVTSFILGDVLMSMLDPRISFSSKAR